MQVELFPDAQCLDASFEITPNAEFGKGSIAADAGGIFGRHYAGFLGWALVFGRLCGSNAAGDS